MEKMVAVRTRSQCFEIARFLKTIRHPADLTPFPNFDWLPDSIFGKFHTVVDINSYYVLLEYNGTCMPVPYAFLALSPFDLHERYGTI